MKRRQSAILSRLWITDSEFFSQNDLEGEEWIEVKEWNGHLLKPGYYASNKGRLKHGSNIIKGSVDEDGYHQSYVSTSSGTQLNVRVHRLILTVFKGNPGPSIKDPTVQHINHVKLDNRVENLCWMSAFDNNQEGHGVRTKIVDEYGEHFFGSQKAASRYAGRHQDYISEGMKQGYKLTFPDGREIDVYIRIDGEWVRYQPPFPKYKKGCTIDWADGRVLQFDSYRDCDRYLNKPEGYVSNALINNWPVIDDSKGKFYLRNPETGVLVLYVPSKNRRTGSKKCKLTVNGISKIFSSISQAAKAIGRDSEYVRISLRDNKPIKDKAGCPVELIILGGSNE